ncbi:hypothetical protein LEMLEM_LOCUS21004, partial [Lemmus lemmus]
APGRTAFLRRRHWWGILLHRVWREHQCPTPPQRTRRSSLRLSRGASGSSSRRSAGDLVLGRPTKAWKSKVKGPASSKDLPSTSSHGGRLKGKRAHSRMQHSPLQHH